MPWPDVKAARQVIDQVRADALAHFAERERVGDAEDVTE